MKSRLATLTGAATVVLLAACAKQERVREIDWARAALARNPAFEIVATDDSAGVFTVRDTTTGTVRTLRLEDLIAAPPPPKAATRTAVGAEPAAAAAPALEAAAPGAPASAPPGALTAQTTEDVKAVPASGGEPVSEGPGYSITRGGETPVAAPETALEGPGYSITRHESVPHANTNTAEAQAVASNVEKRTDPIICQGDRLMRIDGETIEFTGDALIVEKGCDLYISNTNIRAGGVGIIARQARVHIVNSSIGGTRGSYEASDGAEIYVARSTFTGIGRRFDSATMNDLGGNAYQTQ